MKEDFNPKAISKLMGHSKEIITMDVYSDNKNILADGVPEIEAYMKDVLYEADEEGKFKQELLEILPDINQFIQDGN